MLPEVESYKNNGQRCAKRHCSFLKQGLIRPVARGGSGGSYDPPQLPIPKILFHPLAILFHPLAILFHLSAILFHPLAILFHPSAILFHPSAILFHPWNMDDVTRAMSKGGGACECPRVGAFFKLMTSCGQCPRGGCAWCSTHPSSDPPPTWLAGYGPANSSKAEMEVHVHTTTVTVWLY